MANESFEKDFEKYNGMAAVRKAVKTHEKKVVRPEADMVAEGIDPLFDEHEQVEEHNYC